MKATGGGDRLAHGPLVELCGILVAQLAQQSVQRPSGRAGVASEEAAEPFVLDDLADGGCPPTCDELVAEALVGRTA